MKMSSLFVLLIFIIPGLLQAQFLDNFDKDDIEGWFFFTGDGKATMDFVQNEGFARILVDARADKYNVWWAIIKRNVATFLDMKELPKPGFELRVEARVRLSQAPRRINFMINTQRTTNYHEHLMEYDIADTSEWHTISMTTKNLDAQPGDSLYVQLGVTDWGLDTYHVDLDYYRADIINVDDAGPDKGEPLPYHPPLPDIDTFLHKLNVSQDAVINKDFPEVNFNDWHSGQQQKVHVLTVTSRQWIILRWDFDKLLNKQATGPGILELSTHSILQGGDYIEAFGSDLGMEFGKVRVVEIIGGDSLWNQEQVTYNNLLNGHAEEVFNSQMAYDAELSQEQGGRNFITIARPVLQRLLDGRTRGLLVKPLGALIVSFYALESTPDNNGAKLYFNTSD